MKEATVDLLDKQAKLSCTQKEVVVPIQGTELEQLMYATGYISGYHDGLKKARTAIKSAVELDEKQ